MDIASVFNFEKSNAALVNLEKLLMCKDCKQVCKTPRSHDCGYLLCSCSKKDSCPGCGLRCLPSNTSPAYHINSIIEATKIIRTLIHRKDQEKIERKNEIVQNSKRGNGNDTPTVAEPNVEKKDEKVSGSFKIPNNSLSLKKKNEVLSTQSTNVKDTARGTRAYERTLIVQNVGQSASCSKKATALKDMPANIKAIMKRNAKGETKLHSACVKGDKKKIEELIKAGADPCTKDNAGWTPLHEAVSKGYVSIAKLLLEAGALVNVPGGYNNTPLHDAALNDHLEAARLLIAYGANPHLKNIEGNTAFSMVQSKEMEVILKGYDSTKVVQNMIKSPFYRHEVILCGFELPINEQKWLHSMSDRFKLKTITSYNSDVTHIIVSTSDRRCDLAMDILQGILRGKWIVDSKWLYSCLKSNTIEDPSEYEIVGTTRFPDSLAPKRSRENFEKMQPSIFNGCHFYFSGVDKITVEDITFTRSMLSSLVIRGDGLMLTREPNPEAIPAHECTVPYHANNGIFTKCSHFILYQPGRREPLLKYNMPHVKSLPVSWLLNCTETFSLTESF